MPTKVLIADDEPDLELLIRQRFHKQIRQKIYEFTFAQNGEEALEKLQEDTEIGVVMTDLNMPVMDGLTLLSRIGSLSRTIKVVIVSAYGDMQNIRTAMNRGAYDFLTKPIDFEDFEVTMQKTIQEVTLLEEAQRAHQRWAAVRQFFSPGLAEQLERNPALLEGRNQDVTILVSDLRGFSSLAERLGAQQTCRLVQDMMERLSNRIVEYDGLIVDYVGDGILAMWNAPVSQENHPLLACRAALAMLQEMPALAADWQNVVEGPLTLGIGVNTGVAQVGVSGRRRRRAGPEQAFRNTALDYRRNAKPLAGGLSGMPFGHGATSRDRQPSQALRTAFNAACRELAGVSRCIRKRAGHVRSSPFCRSSGDSGLYARYTPGGRQCRSRQIVTRTSERVSESAANDIRSGPVLDSALITCNSRVLEGFH